MLRFLITDILFTLALAVTTAIYAVYLEDRKGISRETSKQIGNEAKAKMDAALPNCFKIQVPMWVAVPINVFIFLLSPLWLIWYVYEYIKLIDAYDPEEEST